MQPTTLHWVGQSDGAGQSDGYLVLLDQTLLPTQVVEIECHTVQDVWEAIRVLQVRGAPAIGIAAAYGVCLSLHAILETIQNSPNGWRLAIERSLAACDHLASSRPTAVNLFWALQRMREVIVEAQKATTDDSGSPQDLAGRLLAEALAIHEEDRQQCASIGRYGAQLMAELPVGSGILTHCNAGALATGGDGTALSVLYTLAQQGKRPHVFADETRPLLQGARLTMWELTQRHIDATLLCDNMAAQVMREGRVQAVITGADRITACGDVANKIGTYGLAVLARAHDLPFYIAAPTSTFDMSMEAGDQIPIEQRPVTEITHSFGHAIAPEKVQVYNPAFDVTPAELITAIITQQGIIGPVNRENVRQVVC
jgi:methylthioribose-1-phosphate isomerase